MKYTTIKIHDEWSLKEKLAADKITQGEFFKICQDSYISNDSKVRKVWNYLIEQFGDISYGKSSKNENVQ